MFDELDFQLTVIREDGLNWQTWSFIVTFTKTTGVLEQNVSC